MIVKRKEVDVIIILSLLNSTWSIIFLKITEVRAKKPTRSVPNGSGGFDMFK